MNLLSIMEQELNKPKIKNLTLDLHSHLLPKMQKEMADKFVAMLFGTSSYVSCCPLRH